MPGKSAPRTPASALTALTPVSAPAPDAASLLQTARDHDAAGRVTDAIHAYGASIEAADLRGEPRVLAEALRRLAMIRFRRHEFDQARGLLDRSLGVAMAAGEPVLAAETLNAIAVTHIQRGEWEIARTHLDRALELGADDDHLRGFIEQNLGTMANIQGEVDEALGHYRRSLIAFARARNDRGRAIAYHNLGMNSADREQWNEADDYFTSSLGLADTLGDVALRGHVLINRTEVHLAQARYEEARSAAEESLRIFDQLGACDRKSTAYKFLGVLYRETGRPQLAEARFATALELAAAVGATGEEAEAAREFAVLQQQLGRNQDALRLLDRSHRLFSKLNARRDLIDVTSRVNRLEQVYLEIVREWGRSIESADSYTFGHSERVARYAAAVAGTLGLSDDLLTTVRIGAHLHDLGKVRIPHEILNKPGRLTADEFAVMQMHPVYGVEMLADVNFPWDIKPLIRSHHEKLGGGGYPDGLRGDELPISAQVICAVDVYDALTTTRSYRGAMAHADAVGEMRRSSSWWRSDVFDAFMESVGRGDGPTGASSGQLAA